jgi:hypothetical protein
MSRPRVEPRPGVVPAHMNRPADKTVRGKARRKVQATASTDYPPGYFTALLWPATNWPHPGWVPECARDLAREARITRTFSELATGAIDAGRVWPMLLPGTPVHDAPGRLKAR